MSKHQPKTKAKPKADQRTLVTFLLDQTGSMQSIKDDTIGGFNSYLATLQGAGNLIDFTLIKFDSNKIEKVCVAVPVGEVDDLNDGTYQPGASTPLIDAAYKTIKAVEKSLNGGDPKIVVCIQTDGQENASTEHTWDELNALIKEKTAAGWQFNFLGTGIDAYDTGSRMGISAMASLSSGMSPQHVRASYSALAGATRSFAVGASANTDLSMQSRAASGDEHYERVFGAGQQQNQMNPPVSTSTPPTVLSKHKAVDDFTL